MDLYFGKIKSKKFVPYEYRYNNYREYMNVQYNHIRYLETTIDTLIQDVMLLDNRLKSLTKESKEIKEPKEPK